MHPVIDYEYDFPSLTNDTAGSIRVTVSSELMQNYATGRLVGTQGGAAMAAVRDPQGDPAVLVAGESGHLFLVRS